jgi:hypothetical protein
MRDGEYASIERDSKSAKLQNLLILAIDSFRCFGLSQMRL